MDGCLHRGGIQRRFISQKPHNAFDPRLGIGDQAGIIDDQRIEPRKCDSANVDGVAAVRLKKLVNSNWAAGKAFELYCPVVISK